MSNLSGATWSQLEHRISVFPRFDHVVLVAIPIDEDISVSNEQGMHRRVFFDKEVVDTEDAIVPDAQELLALNISLLISDLSFRVVPVVRS